MPMSKAGINQHGRLGEASSRGEDDTFKYQVVEPQQTMIERMFTRMLRLDFGVPEAEFRFRELDSRDEWGRAQTASLLAGGKAVLTVNEARALLGLPPVDGGDGL
ncbi:MAG: phage portal protein [Armatimonadetes bacterium]|nr:phage portal protein [Armatimonadota bacterium]